MSTRSYLSIGDVLSLLREEFPDVTISKIRFLESQGLVDPERSPSGYRKFYEHDVDRLRWVLRQQRDQFLPLKVIRDRLAAAGNGVPVDDVPMPGEAESGRTAQPEGWANGAAAEETDAGMSRATVGAAATREWPLPEQQSAQWRRPEPAATNVVHLGPERRQAVGGHPATGGGAVGGPAPSTSARAPGARPGMRSGIDAGPHEVPESALADRAEGDPEGPETGRGRSSAPAGGAPAPGTPPAGGPRAERPEGLFEEPAGGEQAGAGKGGRAAERSATVRTERPAGTEGHLQPGSAAPGAPGGALSGGVSGVSLTPAELSGASGLSAQTLATLEGFGLIAPMAIAGETFYDEEALTVAKLVAEFAKFGIEPRHLRLYRNAVDREVGLVEQVITPLLRQRNPEARQRAVDAAAEMTRLGQSLRAALVRSELRRQLGG